MDVFRVCMIDTQERSGRAHGRVRDILHEGGTVHAAVIPHEGDNSDQTVGVWRRPNRWVVEHVRVVESGGHGGSPAVVARFKNQLTQSLRVFLGWFVQRREK